MLFGYLTLFTALILSISAAVYSILGLTAIFAAAFWPIVILGGSLEFGKIVTTLWLHKYWEQAQLQYKIYLCSAVAILMLLTSMGVFGFLSKAHLDQAVPSGDVAAKVQIYDDKIRTQQDNIKAARAALTQMDAAVDQTMSRSTTESGADKAANLRRSQARERTTLQNDIAKAQKEITTLQEQRAPIASEMRKVEAEVGPIKYIAALIYGDNPEANLLEKAVRWVIILIVIVFDPLALTLLLAATKTFEWERSVNVFAPKRQRTDNGALTEDQLKQINDALHDARDKKELDEFFDRAKQTAHSIDTGTYEPPEQELVKNKSILARLDNMWNRTNNLVKQDTEAEHAPIEEPVIDRIDDEFTKDKIAERAWKDENPGKTLKHERDLLDAGVIKILPWQEPAFRARVLGEISLTADNTPHSGEVKGFGTQFPASPGKGDMFLRVDRLPSALYKFNGNIWIEVDKSLSDQHAYDAAYIDHLISKISTGEYDPELLSEAERTSIEQRLSGA
jgi:hypothetical protein